MTFVIENKGKATVDSLKLDLALFNTEGAVYAAWWSTWRRCAPPKPS